MNKFRRKKKEKKILSRHLKWLPKKNLILSLSSSLLFFLTIPPFNMYYLGFITFIPFFLIQEEENRLYKLFFYGWIMGCVLYFLSFFWLIHTIELFGGLSPFLSGAVFFLFCLLFGLKYGIFFWLANTLQQYFKISMFLSYGAALLMVELFYPELFPAYLGNTQAYHFYFIQVVDVIGIKGMSFVVISLNYFLYELMLNRERRMLALLISLAFVIYSYGAIRVMQIQEYQKRAPSLNIGLIQPDTPFIWGITPSDFQRISDQVITLTTQLEAKSKETLDLIVWPESATPFDISFKNRFSEKVRNFMESRKTAFIFNETNFFAYKSGEPLYSMASYMDSAGKITDHYHKIYLLPFGEYLPLSQLFPGLLSLFPQIGNFQPGNEIKNFRHASQIQITPLICYEVLHADFVRKFIQKDSDLIVNLTNDKWFGKTQASFRHLWLLYPRAVENRIPLIRATNSGSSVVIDQTGTIIAGPTEIYQKDFLAAKVFMVGKIFGLYTYLGDSFLYLILVYVLYLIYRNRKTRGIPAL